MWELPFKIHLFKIFLEELVMYEGCFTPYPCKKMCQRWWRSQEEHSARCLVEMALTCAEGPGVCGCVVSFIHALHVYRGIFSSELNRIQPFWRQIIISMHHKVLLSYLLSETSTLFFNKKYEAWIWRHTQRNNTIISLLIWYIFVLKNITVSFHQISFTPGLDLFFLQWRAL